MPCTDGNTSQGNNTIPETGERETVSEQAVSSCGTAEMWHVLPCTIFTIPTPTISPVQGKYSIRYIFVKWQIGYKNTSHKSS